MRAGDLGGAARGDARRSVLHHLRIQALSYAGHLTRRFFGALWPGGPPAGDETWVEATLGAGSRPLGLWRRMSGPDRRHAVGVAREVARVLGDEATGPVLAAALLHDVGKVEAGFGTLARVPLTFLGLAGGWARAAKWAAGGGLRRRAGLYLTHADVGAEMLRAAGADPLTVAWAAEHHLPPERWTVPASVATALKAGDDD